MELLEVLLRRRSVRAYLPDPVPPEVLARICGTAARAPSAGNLQSYRIYVVRDRPRRDRLAAAAGAQSFLAEAPVALVFFADRARSAATYGARGAQLYAVQDATIAASYAVLAAVNEGLATAWVGAFEEDPVREVCEAPGLDPVAIVPVGRAREDPAPTPRRPLAEIVRGL